MYSSLLQVFLKTFKKHLDFSYICCYNIGSNKNGGKHQWLIRLLMIA